MTYPSVPHILLTRLIRKKTYKALVTYNFGRKGNTKKIGWYAYSINKSPLFIGSNYVEAKSYIDNLPKNSIIRRFVPNFMLEKRGAS